MANNKIFYFIRTTRLAVRSVLSSSWRSLLSIFTILLGAVAMVTTLTLNINVDHYIDKMIAQTGGPTLTLSLPARSGSFFAIEDLSFLRSFPNVAHVIPVFQTDEAVIRYRDNFFNPKLIGMERDYHKIVQLKLLSGNLLSDFDFKEDTATAVISPHTAKILKLREPIGKIITLRVGSSDLAVRIVGLAKLDSQQDFDLGFAWIPRGFFTELMGRSSINDMKVTATSFEGMNALEKTLREKLKFSYGENLRFFNPFTNLEEMRLQLKSLVYAGLALGVLALFSGSVGIMNTMLLTVRLRRREIGLYRSLGFSCNKILIIFLMESFLLSCAGGVLGIVFGGILGVSLSALLVAPYQELSPGAMVLGLTLTVAIGCGFGLVPARRAAALTPVEALRG